MQMNCPKCSREVTARFNDGKSLHKGGLGCWFRCRCTHSWATKMNAEGVHTIVAQTPAKVTMIRRRDTDK